MGRYVKMRRCEDEKMFHRPPLLEEPCAQTLSGKKHPKFAQMAFLIFFHGIFHGFSVVACSIDSQNLWKMQWKMWEYLDSPNVGFSIVFHRFHEIFANFLCFSIDFPSKAKALPLASSSESVDLEATALESSQFSQMFDDFGGVE